MADNQPTTAVDLVPHARFSRRVTRRALMLGVAALLGIVAGCAATILIMLERLETRNASFQPPMTALERQQLLPADPVLDTTPRLDGLRYGQGSDSAAQGYMPTGNSAAAQHNSLGHTALLHMHNEDLHATAQTRSVSQTAR